MSDPVTNVEIEDVLSSIRRLVSVDSARTRRAPLPDMATEVPVAPQKLVLTEDYRIDPEPPEVADAAEAERARTADLAADYTRTLERRIAELEAAVNAQAAEYEPDGSEDTAQHRPTAALFLPPRDKPGAVQPEDGALPLDALVADAEPMPDDDATPPEATAATPDEGEAQVEHHAMWSDDDEAALFRPAAEDDRVEVLEAESHRTSAKRGDDSDFSFTSDDTLIDEETLRDMVAEIVRDELQGALGERITRNVRKLVRREIMRAISIRDFE